MNIEVEIKIAVDDFTEIKKILTQKGSLAKAIHQIDEYYTPIQRNFYTAKPPTEWLRIRTNPDKTIFEYDKSIGKNEHGIQEYVEEYETEISAPDELHKILAFLDFKLIATVDKYREYWNCGDLEIALDDIKELGKFIEVEAKGDFVSNAAAKQACADFLTELGLKTKQEINKGYPILLMEKLNQL